MKLKMLLMATCLLLPMSSAFAETTDEYVAGLKKEASIGNTEAQKELDQFQALSEKANAGDAQAQYELGMFYKAKADKYYETEYSVNEGDEQKLQEWLGKAANQGSIKAQRALVSFYQKKYNSLQSDYSFSGKKERQEANEKLEEWLLKLAKKGNAQDEYTLALYYTKSDDDKVKEKAGIWIEKAANQDITNAQIMLGRGYLFGIDGINKNYNKAKDIFEKLADQGNVEGLYFLAVCYSSGYGVPKDEKKAIELYEAAADKGNTHAAAILSKSYLTGIDNNIPPDREKFRHYYNQVCSEDQLECATLKGDIMEKCSKMHPNQDLVRSDIDSDCRQVIVGVLRNMK